MVGLQLFKTSCFKLYLIKFKFSKNPIKNRKINFLNLPKKLFKIQKKKVQSATSIIKSL